MKVSKLIEITEMEERDIRDAVELTDKEDWSNTAEDWERLYRIGGSIVAKEGGEVIGISTALDFGKIGTIGNVVVKEEERLSGIGRLLVEKSIEILKKCETIKVHSLMPAASFYRKFDFIPAGMSTYFEFKMDENSMQPFDIFESEDIISIDDCWESVAEIDKRQFGGDRKKLLAEFKKTVPEMALAKISDSGEVQSYIMAKGDERYYEIGPWVIEPGCKDWKSLFDRAVSSVKRGSEIGILVPSQNYRITSYLESIGYEAKMYTTDMLRGGAWPNEENICARGGGDKG
mgnify:FL=1